MSTLESIEVLLAGLQVQDAQVQGQNVLKVCEHIKQYPVDGRRAVPNIAPFLEGQDETLISPCMNAIIAVANFDPSSVVPAVRQIVNMLNNVIYRGMDHPTNWEDMANAADVLGRVATINTEAVLSAIPILTRVLTPPFYKTSDFPAGVERFYAKAAQAIGQIGANHPDSVKEVVPTLMKCLVDTYSSPVLMEDAKRPDGFRPMLVFSLHEIGKASPSHVIPSLVKVLTHPVNDVRKNAIEILDKVARDPRQAIPSLVQCMQSMDQELAKNAALTLGGLGQKTPELVVPHLLKVLTSNNTNTLRNATNTLISISKARPGELTNAVPYLINLLNNSNVDIKQQTVRVIRNIGKNNVAEISDAIPFLVFQYMNDQSTEMKTEVRDCLADIGVDLEKYTLVVNTLRKTQELIPEVVGKKKPTNEIEDLIKESKKFLSSLEYDKAVEISTTAFNKAMEGAEKDASEVAPPTAAPKEAALERSVLSYRFDDFVVGPSNSFAQAAAIAVADNPAGAYNPLFIHSGPGLGKTHLLNAIGNHFQERNPEGNVVYITSEKFTNELIQAIQSKSIDVFRARYRNVDILLIDDIQFIAGKEHTQEEFFHTFNALFNSQKQIVVTSDKPPSEIPTLEERLRSRFEWGLITDISAPSFETKVAILRSKSDVKKVEVKDDVLALIANNSGNNIRELEGALNEVVGYAQLTKKDITQDLSKNVLKITEGKAESKIDIEWGATYVSKDPTTTTAYEFAKAMMEKDAPTQIISRVHPDKIKKKYALDPAKEILWLSKSPGKECRSPTNIGKLAFSIDQFIKKNKDAIVVFDGLEYLISNNDFSMALRFLEDINESVVINNAIMVVPISEETYSTKELTLLERNMLQLTEKHRECVSDFFECETDDETMKAKQEEELKKRENQQKEILDLIQKIQDGILSMSGMGVDTSDVDDQFQEVRIKSNNKDYPVAIKLATEVLDKIEAATKDKVESIKGEIETAKELLARAEELGVADQHLKSTLNQAIGAYELKMFDQALTLIKQCQKETFAVVEYRDTVNLLKEAREKIDFARENKIDVDASAELLKKAKPAIVDKDYKEARNIAQQALDVALSAIGESQKQEKDKERKEQFTDLMSKINAAKQKLSDAMSKSEEQEKAVGVDEEPAKEEPAKEEEAPAEEEAAKEEEPTKEEEAPADEEKEEEPAKEEPPTIETTDDGKPICPSCGAVLLKGSVFCNKCGTKLG